MIELVILALSTLAILSIGTFVYLRNPRYVVNRIYALLTVSLALYPVANYFSLHVSERLFFMRAVVLLTSVAVAALYYLVYFFGSEGKKLSTLSIPQKIGVYYTVFVAVLCMTPLVFSGINGGPNPSPIPNFGALFFFLQLLVFPAVSVIALIKRVRKSHNAQRQQYIYMLIGIAPIFLLAPLTGFILPVILKQTNFATVNPIYAAFFVGMIGYAIVKHRLFDIRFYVVRATAYIFTLLLLSLLYVAPLFYLLGNVVMRFPWAPYKFIAGVIVGTVAALYFEAVKRRFDRVTAKIFFRDAYEPGVLLGELNRILATTIDIRKLLSDSSSVLSTHLKPEFCDFALYGAGSWDQRLVGTDARRLSSAEVNRSLHAISDAAPGIIVTDFLGEEAQDTKHALTKNNIAVVVPLMSKVEGGSKTLLGYLLLGYKKSGNAYNNQDVETLNSVADALVIGIQNALQFEEIQNFNLTLQRRIEEATAKLRRTNAKLQALDETKDDFISMASHQLRTPLTSVKGYLSMVLEGDAGKLTEMQRKMLDQAFISSQRMVFLIADLLNVSRLKTGKFIIEPSQVNLAKTVADEVNQLKETAKARELELIYERPAEFPTLMIDETKIRQVIMNFIDNAIYYTPVGGKIIIELIDKANTVEFKVIDTGIGVPKREQPHLFTKFYRAGNARQARPDGTGLGLFMAKKVIIAQGGAVIFQSSEGKGSTFGFVFSKEKLAAPNPNKPVESEAVASRKNTAHDY